MGILDGLFDFDGNGKVDLWDDILFMSFFDEISQGAKKEQHEIELPPTHKNTSPARSVINTPMITNTEKMELRKRLSNLRRDISSVPKIYTMEQLEEVENIKSRLLTLLIEAVQLRPGFSDCAIYKEWRETCREAKCCIFSVAYADALLSGKRSPFIDTTGLSLSDLEQEQEQLADNEPEDVLSIEWDKWYSQFKENEEKMLDLE